jgi:hypothetical protein
MTLLHENDGSGVSGAIRLTTEKGFSAHATIGEVDTIGVVVDDDAGALDFVGWRTWRMIEDACPAGAQVVWSGLVGDQDISRGDNGLLHTIGAAREWGLTVHEANRYLTRRVLTTGAKRPRESISTRITWLLTQPGFDGVIFDHGNVQASSLMTDANDYTLQPGAQVLRDCANLLGWNFFTRYREASDDHELIFRDDILNQDDTRDFRLSNDDADEDGPTGGNTWIIAGEPRAKLKRGADRIAAGAGVVYTGGFVYGTEPSTEAAFGPVDQVAPTATIKSKTVAAGLVARFLEDHDTQSEVVACRVLLPAANLNDFLQGQRIHAKFTHFPGWEDFRPCRVVWKAFGRPENESQAVYEVDVELVPVIELTPVSSHARITRPKSTSYQGGGVYQLIWSFDGDIPKAGDPYDAKYGAVAYVGTEPTDGTHEGTLSGLSVSGGGTPHVYLKCSMADVVTGDITVTLAIRVNGTPVASGTYVSSGGLRFIAPVIVVEADVAVVSGDVIEGWMSNSDGGTFTIPSGTGEATQKLMLTGDLT